MSQFSPDEMSALDAPKRRPVRFSVVRKCIAIAALLWPLHAAPPALGATQPANVRAAFGNTVLTIDPDGRSRKIWLQPDGTWTGKSRRGLSLAGKWSVRGDKVCLSQSKPKLFGRMCEVFPTDPARGIEARDPTGKVIQLKLVKGHVER